MVTMDYRMDRIRLFTDDGMMMHRNEYVLASRAARCLRIVASAFCDSISQRATSLAFRTSDEMPRLTWRFCRMMPK
jgi:hypothetical protein